MRNLHAAPVFCIVAVLAAAPFALGARAQEPPSCLPAPSGMVGWWPGDGNALDIQGGAHGTLQGGATFGPGTVGQAFSVATADVKVPASASLDVGAGNGFTIDLWINPASLAEQPLVEWNDNYSPQPWGVHLWISGLGIVGNLYANITDTSGINHQLYTGSGVVTANAFQHVALTYDKTYGTTFLYHNGRVVASATLGTFTPWTAPDLYFARRSTGHWPVTPFGGLLDEIELYNRALSESEISAIFNAGSAGKCKGLGLPSCMPAPAGMVSWWPGDGNALDIQGGNHGILRGNATFGPGMVGQAFSFDGIPAHVKIPAAPSLDVGPGSGLTIDLWINPASLAEQPLVEWNDNSSPQPIGVHLWISVASPGDLFGGLVDTAGNAHLVYSGSGVIAANTFQHVALIYDKTSGVASLYRNGEAVATQVLGTFTPWTSTDLYFGHRPAGYMPAVFGGSLDEIELYARALSASEIAAIFNAGSAGKCKPLSAPASFYTLPPCRVADTRSGPPLDSGAPRVFPIAGLCGVPLTARAVAINLTVVAPTADGHVTLYPSGSPAPGTSTINFRAGNTRANNAILPLGGGAVSAVASLQGSGQAHLVIDVSGYFE